MISRLRLFFCIIALASGSAGPSRQLPTTTPAMGSFLFTGQTADGWAWTNTQWKSKVDEYTIIRHQIDSALAAGQSPEELYLDARQKALTSSTNPGAQFRWGYLAWKVLPLVSTWSGKLAVLNGIVEAMARIPSPSSFDYIRTRFLVESYELPSLRLQAVAERLLSAGGREDDDVSRQYCYILLSSPSAEIIRQRSLPISQSLLNSDPGNPENYHLIAAIYDAICTKSGRYDQDDVNKAITNYELYLKHIPSNPYEQRRIERIIVWLRQKELH